MLYKNDELVKQIDEEITQEVFRQLLIKNKIAKAYRMIFDDKYEFNEDTYGPCGNTINIFKDNNNTWLVWEDVDYEVFMGYFGGKHIEVRQFDSQEKAYIDAAKRSRLHISHEDLMYDINNTDSMLDIVRSAKLFLKIAIDIYNSSKSAQKYLLLETFEKELLKKNSVHEKLVRKKD